jgi:GR25 family glycosyltransferase involved in LPS biosynthesis
MPLIQLLFPRAQEFEAVDAASVDVATDPRVSVYARHFIAENGSSDHMHLGSAGAVGCALSHIALWRRCVELNEPIMVIEDDIDLTPRKRAQVAEAVENIPGACDYASIMYLPATFMLLPNNGQGCADGAQKWCDIKLGLYGHFGTQMYYVTPRGAAILLEQALPIVTHIDVYIAAVSSTRADFTGLRWRENIYSTINMIEDNESSTLEHPVSNGLLRKRLPSSNAFFIAVMVAVLALVVWSVTITVKYYRQ